MSEFLSTLFATSTWKESLVTACWRWVSVIQRRC